MTKRSVLKAFALCWMALLMLLCAGAAGASAGAGIEVHVNGNKVGFPDQKPFIAPEAQRTYVPLRFVSEALGAIVHWDGAAKTALVSTDQKSISMPVNSSIAKVDGADTPLDAPALLVRGRTMVPLRFVSEVLGAQVNWVAPDGSGPGKVLITIADDPAEDDDPAEGDEEIPDGPWTLSADESNGRTALRIESPVPFDYNVFTLARPDRLVIDLAGVSADIPADIELDSEAVSRVRTGFTDNPPTGRVVCDLAGGLGFTRYRVEAGADRRSLQLEIWTVESVLDDRVIVLDPGHGGADPGAIGPSGLQEKDVNLSVAQKTARLLRQEGAEVILTRTGDVRLGEVQREDLEARCRIANNHQADLFVSLHSNASVSPSYQGTSVYYHAHPANSAENVKLARALQDSLVRSLGRNDLGVYSCNFYVLKNTNMPGALVETAFLSNSQEEQLLAQDWFREKTAAAVVEGIKAYWG